MNFKTRFAQKHWEIDIARYERLKRMADTFHTESLRLHVLEQMETIKKSYPNHQKYFDELT